MRGKVSTVLRGERDGGNGGDDENKKIGRRAHGGLQKDLPGGVQNDWVSTFC